MTDRLDRSPRRGPDGLDETLAELSTYVEELRTAREQLELQNEELAAARLLADAERQRYEELFEFAPDGYLVTDTGGNILEANRAALGLLGGPASATVGKPLATFVASRDRPQFHEGLSRVLREGRTDGWAIRLSPRGRASFRAEVTAERTEDAEGSAPGIRWLIRDVTRQKRAERRIVGLSDDLERRVEQRTKQLLELETLRGELETEKHRATAEAAAAEQEARRAAAELRELQAITDSLLGRLRLDDLLHELLQRVRSAIGSDTATILLPTPDGVNLAVRAEVGDVEEHVGEIRVPIGRGIAGTIAATRHPVIAPDVIAAGAHSRFLRERIASLVGVPILSGSALVGVLHAGSHTPRRFTDEDVRFLELVAQRAALAIEGSRVFEAEQAARRDAEAAQTRLAFVAEASTVLAASLSSPEALENLGRLATTFLTDLCLIDVIEEDGTVRRVAAVHGDPAKQRLARQLNEWFAPDPSGPHPAVAVMRDGRSRYSPDMPDEFLRRTTRDDEHYRVVKELGFRSYVCVPIVARGTILGTLTLVSCDERRRYGPSDVTLAEDLARRAGMAIDNARLLDAEQRARVAAERAAALTAVLQNVTAALSETYTVEHVARVVADQILPVVGASAASVALLRAGEASLEVMAAEGYAESVLEEWRRIPVEADVPLAEAVRTVEPLFIGSREEIGRRYPALVARGEVVSDALAAIPIVVRGRVLGAMGLSYGGERAFSAEDRALMVALARQCGQALERARLYESERDAHQQARAAQRRVAFLADASRILAETLDYRETLQQVAHLALSVLADLCIVDLVTPEGSVERVVAAAARPALEAVAEELRAAPSPPSADPGARAIRRGEIEVVPPGSRPDARSLGPLSAVAEHGLISVPLEARGRVLGAITLVSASPRFRYGEDDRELAEALAQRAAVAVDNARLYGERDHIARTLQRSLLPLELPSIPRMELAARYRAAGEGNDVGGDFYDAFGTVDGSWVVVVGDVCGKGPEAAAVAVLARHSLRTAALGERRPSAALGLLNEAMLQREGEQRFCTVAYVRVHPGHDGVRLTVCCAGHPLPLVVRADGRVEPVGEPGALLGVFSEPLLSDVPFDLEPGDALVLYTDGVTEEHTHGEFFGLRRLRDIVASCAGQPAEAIADRIERAVVGFSAGAPGDDVTVVALRMTPT